MASAFDGDRLTDDEKEALCRQLLAEFGATRVKPSGDGELIHSCVLPLGGHTHGDIHPSASLNYKKLVYNCLGCGNSGSLMWFIAICRGTSSTDARKWLRDQTGQKDDAEPLSHLLDFFDSVYDPKRFMDAPLPKLDQRVLNPWMVIHPYLTEMRGIPEQNIMDFKVGWNSETNRIVIPHFWKGDLVGWQTRRLINDGSLKYQSTPDFPKDQTIFNYDPKNYREAIVVESPMSVIAKHHVAEHMVATFGAKVTDRQIKLLSLYANVLLWFDNDKAGWKATERVGAMLEPYCNVSVAGNPWAADAGDLNEKAFGIVLQRPISFAIWRPPTQLFEWKGVADEEVRAGQDTSRA